MSTPTPEKVTRPAGSVLCKSAPCGRISFAPWQNKDKDKAFYNDATIFVSFENGLTRVLTDAEAASWTNATINYVIPEGAQHDEKWLSLVHYDLALRA